MLLAPLGRELLVWPSAVQLLSTGHTDVHWSRFVVSITSFGFAATLATLKVIDRLLDLVDARVRYLARERSAQ
ncbi:MAG: hypothetical protein U5J83_01035 [Bryobacterales bacterium]|nr:hypothetical protein [Bryobacterales bacterium]